MKVEKISTSIMKSKLHNEIYIIATLAETCAALFAHTYNSSDSKSVIIEAEFINEVLVKACWVNSIDEEDPKVRKNSIKYTFEDDSSITLKLY